ncbi:MAG: PAS domain-containing protein [Gemmatimonadota bacterium]
MTDERSAEADALRRRAEEALLNRHAGERGPEPDPRRLIHELQVHQIELEMQNEEVQRALETAEEARERFMDLYDFAPTGYATLDRNSEMLELNLAAASLLGLERGRLVGRRLGDFVVEGDRQGFHDWLADSTATGTRQTADFAVNTPGAGPRTVQAEGMLAPDAVHCRVSLIDVTVRRGLELALRLRDRAVRAVSQGIMITEPGRDDNPIIYVNPGFERITGYSSADVVGRDARFLNGADTDPATVSTIRRAIRDAAPCAVELLNYRKDGTTFWNGLHITPVFDDRDRLSHFIGLILDVTALRTMEAAFRQSQRMEAVGQMAGGVAHDFNNLLTVINGFADLLGHEVGGNKAAAEMVAEIAKAGSRAAGLTRQLLAFSRKQVLKPEVLEVNGVVSGLTTMLERLLGEDVALQLRLDPVAGFIKADRGQIEQVLVNLVINARDAMPHGGALTIATTHEVRDHATPVAHGELPAGRYVKLTVTDTGKGMDLATKARCFEPFFTTKAVGQGTGMGLAMVYGLVTQSGGTVDVRSEVGKGSEFSIFLPFHSSHGRPTPPLPEVAITAPSGFESILLVEDEPAVRALICRILQMQGYQVIEARDGLEALRQLAAASVPVKLVITDVVMPEMGGRELGERVRAQFPAMPMLYMSGYTDDALMRQGIDLEEAAFVQKPFTPAVLSLKVRQLLDHVVKAIA